MIPRHPEHTSSDPNGAAPSALAEPERSVAGPTAAGRAALDAAQALARKAAAPATLRAYKADWTHYAAWCAEHGFVPVPAAPATVGAYLASLAGTHAPATIRRRLAALGKMHRFNDLPWNTAHRDIQGALSTCRAKESLVLPVLDRRHHRALGRPIARQLVAGVVAIQLEPLGRRGG